MSLINVSNLTFSYDSSFDNIFENVSFQIDTDWKLGFIGRNGRGKTTFLNLLLGKYEYSGTISACVDFEYFPYVIDDKTRNTLDIISCINNTALEWEIIREFSLLNMSEDILYRPFNTLSNGEQTKALLAALFLKENNFLLIDEPTNHLDISARKTVSQYLNNKKGFILVSHDRNFLDSCVDHIISINKTNIELQKGNFSSWWDNKQKQDHFEMRKNEKLIGEINRLNNAAKRTNDWSDQVEKSKKGTKNSGLRPDRGFIGHKAAKMMKRSKSIENRRLNAVKEKSELLKNIEEIEDLKISPLSFHNNRLISFNNLSIIYDNKSICTDINFSIERGDMISLSGKNGCGKSSLLKLIMGNNINYSGDFIKGSNLIISYIPQDTSGLHGDLSDFIFMNNIDESLFKAILRKLDFSRIQFEKDISQLSAGQKKKIMIAKSLCEKAHLYIWDEPLNYIDIFSRMQIEQLLLKYHPTIIFVEHDKTFCEKIATKIIKL